MMEAGTESEDYLKYIAEESGNVAADGMFSSQAGLHLLLQWPCMPATASQTC